MSVTGGVGGGGKVCAHCNGTMSSGHDARCVMLNVVCVKCNQAVRLMDGAKCPNCGHVHFSSKVVADMAEEKIDHPLHYGSKDDPYEAIKVIEKWGLGFCLGNAVKYICRSEKKGSPLDDLRKAAWYINREIERRSELAMRVCYDSLGEGSLEPGRAQAPLGGRPPEPVRTLEEDGGRAGIVGRGLPQPSWRVRASVWPEPARHDQRPLSHGLGPVLSYRAESESIDMRDEVDVLTNPVPDEREQWVSLFLQGSRGFSHELVRHRHQCAVSQRSTRYVDESESEWVEHPLVTTYKDWADSASDTEREDEYIEETMTDIINQSVEFYDEKVRILQTWLKSRGIDGTQARKQARGAARGFLGNALLTEMIFSASVSQWKHMLHMRCSDAADAEIRMIFSKVLFELKCSRYAKAFDDYELVPAKDGIGMVLKGGGHR